MAWLRCRVQVVVLLLVVTFAQGLPCSFAQVDDAALSAAVAAIPTDAPGMALRKAALEVAIEEVALRRERGDVLPLLGHRNWIVIADAAYPWQVSPGIETIETGATQLEVVRWVLGSLSKTNHIKPTVYLDREMDFLSESAAPGISAYRDSLASLIANRKPAKLDHEKIIAKLDEAGKTFRVLILKTHATLPYTSVFLQLECGYWDAAKERNLRKTIATKGR